ncbi:MAG: zinc ABC transporter substrate-binding protein [candidate division Zixibacteria bacterium]|nr:zinc ABC transporter substrate-binding protein [Candidatus Tariuqbacter arcticus]
MRKIVLLTFISSLIVAGCGGYKSSDSTESSGKIKVFVSIPPQKFFLQRIGGDLVDVQVLVPPGSSPATYEPTAKQMSGLAESQAYFKIGVPFEKSLLKKIENILIDLNVVDTRKGIKLRPIEGEAEHHHHTGEELDPHIWLDPILVKIQAGTICDQLAQLDPAHKAVFENNLAAFQAEIDSVHTKITQLLLPFAGGEFFVFHPSYGYFARRYELEQIAVESSGKEPGAKQLDEIIEKAQKCGINTVFVQNEYSSKTPEAVAGVINGRVVRLNPLSGDYLNNLLDIAQKIAGSFN